MNTKKIPSDNTISIKSLWCSTYLFLRVYKLITFELITPTNGRFLFRKGRQIEADIDQYYKIDIQVPIKQYLQNYNALRDLVMKMKREEIEQQRDQRRCIADI